MDDGVARLDARARRVGFAIVIVSIAALVYLVVLIAGLGTARTPLPEWIAAGVIPLPLFVVAIVVLQVVRRSLVAAAAWAQVLAAESAIDDLERTIDDTARDEGLR